MQTQAQAVRQVRFVNEGPAQGNKVGISGHQHRLHHPPGAKATDQDDGQPGHRPCPPRQGAKVSLVRLRPDPRTGVQVPTSANSPADLDRVQAHALQRPDHLGPFLGGQSALYAVHQTQLDKDRVVGADLLPHRVADSPQKARPSLQIAAPFVSPPVDKGREELAHQVAVRPVYLDAVETGLPGPARGLGVGLDEEGDLVGSHLPRWLAQKGGVHGRGGNRLGHRFPAALHPPVVDLYHDPAALPVDRIGQFRQTGDQVVGMDAGHFGVGLAR